MNPLPTLLIFIVIQFFISSCQTPQKSPNRWYKGNLHTHSYWSDGDEFPEMIMNWYKKIIITLSRFRITTPWQRVKSGK